jgi:hypothetical protein
MISMPMKKMVRTTKYKVMSERRSDDAEQVAARHRLNAVLAPGEGGLQGEEIHHLGKRQGDHGEIDPVPSDRQRAEARPRPAATTVPDRMASSGVSPQIFAAWAET